MNASILVRGPIQKAILDVLSASIGEGDGWIYTGEIAERIPTEVLIDDVECVRRFDRGDDEKAIRINLASNRLGVLLGRMRKAGLVIREDPFNLRASKTDLETPFLGLRGYGQKSLWRLGPMADLLKEEGIID